MTTDTFFGEPFHDVDEWRDEPVRHRYIHGGFEGTKTRFSFYFPPEDQWDGRFVQPDIGGMGGNENIAQTPMADLLGSIPFAVSLGAYLVESNQGHLGMDMDTGSDDPMMAQYLADAHVARYSKQLAEEIYGRAPHHGYRYGGSGGSVRTIMAMENVRDVWDGSVPHLVPSVATANFGFSISSLATRVLGTDLERVIDAVDAGGSGNPFEHLDLEQRQILASMYRAGFPRGAEFSLRNPFEQLLVWAWRGPAMIAADPEYFRTDFWSAPGYAGCDEFAKLEPHIVETTVRVVRVVRAAQIVDTDAESGTTGDVQAQGGGRVLPTGVAIEGAEDTSSLPGCRIEILTGKVAGRELFCVSAFNGVLNAMALGDAGNELFEGVEPGDEISLSNRSVLAFGYLHRHQSYADLPEFEQFKVDGISIFPQRSTDAPDDLPTFTGNFHGKMIMVQNLQDRGTWPTGPVYYERSARPHLGRELDNRFRVYYNERAAHLPGSKQPKGNAPVTTTRLIDFQGIVEQAVRDLIDWVEQDREPPVGSAYHLGPDLGVTVPAAATERGGIQPVVSATVNGAARAEIKAGDEVEFEVLAQTPPDTGGIIAVSWDWYGTGEFAFGHDDVDGKDSSLRRTVRHRYSEPGTYFATVRVTAHRDGDPNARFRRCDNLARVRVVVESRHGRASNEITY